MIQGGAARAWLICSGKCKAKHRLSIEVVEAAGEFLLGQCVSDI